MSEPAPSLSEKTRFSSPDQTRQRLLNAASTVFSRDGFQGATTREIAREAGVNEVTLFRHFRTRDELLRATLERRVIAEADLLAEISNWEGGVERGVANFVRQYNAIMEKKEPLARALIGEARMLPESVRSMILELVRPYRQLLENRLAEAQAAGEIRADLNPECVADILRDVLQAGMLRRTGYCEARYSVDEYLDAVIDLFVRGLEPKKL